MTFACRFVIAIAAVFEIAVVSYCSLMAWLLTGWSLDDAMVEGMRRADWWTIAGQRFAFGCIAAFACAGAVMGANKLIARLVGRANSHWPRVTAVVFWATVSAASLAGALQFALTKPSM